MDNWMDDYMNKRRWIERYEREVTEKERCVENEVEAL